MPQAPKRTQVNVRLEVPGGPDARVLLHACCAPCSGAIVETMVAQGIRPTIFWSNSNIYDKEEYDKRKAEILRYAAEFGLEVVDDDYDHSDWLACAAAGREDAPERGARCLECFKYRLLRAARYAAAHGFDVLTTTLASSRWKSLEQVDAAGAWACSAAEGQQDHQVPKVVWWPMNWRKGGLQPRRAEIIREQNFYNQTFCGCEFSKMA